MRLTNNKLNRTIINKLMKPTVSIPVELTPGIFELREIPNVTCTEFDLLLHLSLIQDQFGNVRGLYYKDVCKDLDCCKQSFYNSLKGLETKGYILINFNYKENSYWNLTIVDNIFVRSEDDKKSYLNTNRKFFYTSEFKCLKVNEKKLLIYLALQKDGFKFYPERVMEWLGIKSITLAWEYINNIAAMCPLIAIPGKHGDKLKIDTTSLVLTELNSNSERTNFLTHRLSYLCKKQNIEYTGTDITNLITLLGQYANVGIGKITAVILSVIESKKSIQGALINKLLNIDPETGEYRPLYL